jgi:hypothetical protein
MYSKVILDALMEQASDKEVSRMVVLINEFSAYRDFADFHRHDPVWWENLAENIYANSPHPKMAVAPLIISAGQYLLETKPEDLTDKVVPLVGKAMAMDEDNNAVQTLAKLVVAVKMGGIETPTIKELRENVLPSLMRSVKKLDVDLSYKE